MDDPEVEDLVESFINGNISHVAEQVTRHPKARCAALAASIALRLAGNQRYGTENAAVFVRSLQRRVK